MNVAVSIVRVSSENEDAHAYLHDLKTRKSAAYESIYREYYKEFMEPISALTSYTVPEIGAAT